MRNIGQVGLIFVLAVQADGTVALAQGYAYYNRLNIQSQDPTPLSSQGIRVARSGTSAPVTRTIRQTDERQPARAEQGLRVGRSEPNTTVARTVYQIEVRQPARVLSIVPSQAPGLEVPAGSTWEQQPRRTVSAPRPEVIARSEPRNYFPNMRTGMTPQPPVTLTASRTFFYPGCQCTPSRSHALGGGSHR
jgi:hypothetical protein